MQIHMRLLALSKKLDSESLLKHLGLISFKRKFIHKFLFLLITECFRWIKKNFLISYQIGRDFVGIEKEQEFIDIALKRKAEFVYKISEGRPNVEDRLKNGDIALVINTSDTKPSVDDGKKIRQNVLRFKIPYFTTIRAALAAAKSLSTVQTGKALEVKSLQEYLSER